MTTISNLQNERIKYQPKVPKVLKENLQHLNIQEESTSEDTNSDSPVKDLFPNLFGLPLIKFSGNSDSNPSPSKALIIGVVLSGGQAPGGHNVIGGLFDAVKKLNPNSILHGFLGGPSGILEKDYITITDEIISHHRNTGGFDMIGSGRTKIESAEQFATCKKVVQEMELDGLVVIGGDDSNTNAGLLAEYFKKEKVNCNVIGVPKTIDGDLKTDKIPVSFGFDTATKVYSYLVGNIGRDVLSAKKYWHFIRLMGRSASHIALEVALQTRPNITLISEEVLEKKMTLSELTESIVKTIMLRAAEGRNYGTALIPEGLIEFIPEVKTLIAEINDLLSAKAEEFQSYGSLKEQVEFVRGQLSKDAEPVYTFLPENIQTQLILDRDPHGNVQVSRIETEKLLISLVEKRLSELKEQGQFKGKFSAVNHFFGYEGRCAFPSNFDAEYTYALGMTAASLLNQGYTGYMASVTNLAEGNENWECGGVPLTSMMTIERRHGEDKPVIEKALVKADGKPFQTLLENRESWAHEDQYMSPGPIQYFGPSVVMDQINKTLELELQ